MTMREARATDLDQIMEIVSAVVEIMNGNNNYQWDKTYPLRPDFVKDVERGELFIAEEDGRIGGLICINDDQPEEYDPLPWTTQLPVLVIHRLAVSPFFQRRGIGQKMLVFSEELALKKGVSAFRTDTNSANPAAQKLFTGFGYQYVGDMRFLGKDSPFYCYEKLLK